MTRDGGISDADVAALLRRAAELDVQLAERQAMLSPAQVEQVALEAGISQAAIRQAIAELSDQPRHTTPSGHMRQGIVPAEHRRLVQALVSAPLAIGMAVAFGGAVNSGFDPHMTMETVSVYAVGGGALSGVAALCARWRHAQPKLGRLHAPTEPPMSGTANG